MCATGISHSSFSLILSLLHTSRLTFTRVAKRHKYIKAYIISNWIAKKESTYFLSLSWSSNLSCSNGPHWLISQNNIGPVWYSFCEKDGRHYRSHKWNKDKIQIHPHTLSKLASFRFRKLCKLPHRNKLFYYRWAKFCEDNPCAFCYYLTLRKQSTFLHTFFYQDSYKIGKFSHST